MLKKSIGFPEQNLCSGTESVFRHRTRIQVERPRNLARDSGAHPRVLTFYRDPDKKRFFDRHKIKITAMVFKDLSD